MDGADRIGGPDEMKSMTRARGGSEADPFPLFAGDCGPGAPPEELANFRATRSAIRLA